MAQADRETIRTLLTDTVTLLCRNSLPFSKLLKVQGLLGITVDESDVYIIQIDEEYGDSGPLEGPGRAIPAMARGPIGSMPPAKRARTAAARMPARRMAQTVPRRMRTAGTNMASPAGGNLGGLVKQKVRQQLNFTTPQKGMAVLKSPPLATPPDTKHPFAMRSPQMGLKASVPAVTPTRAPMMHYQQSPQASAGLQLNPRKMLMLEDEKKPNIDPVAMLKRQKPQQQASKANKVNRTGVDRTGVDRAGVDRTGGFCQQPVKQERPQGDVICVESDEETTDSKKMPDLLPFPSHFQPAEMEEDDKTKALQAIMNKALSEARAVNQGYADNYQDDGFQGDGSYDSSYPTSSGMHLETVVKKMEPVSSSQLSETEMTYDPAEVGSTHLQDDFNSGMDVKPVMDKGSMQLWDPAGAMQSMSDQAPWSLSQSPLLAPTVSSPSWIKTESGQMAPKTPTGPMRNKSISFRSPPPTGAYPSPPYQRSPGIPSRCASAGSVQQQQQQQQQDTSSNWKSVTTTKFICSINNCDKEFTTKRAMRHHQKTLHGSVMGGSGQNSNDGSDFQYDGPDL